jgi:hypothetical protein
MGSRIKIQPLSSRQVRRGANATSFAIDIRTDRHGEYFEIAVGDEAPGFQILQVSPRERHLLLHSEDGQRFLCGHDERHWFVAPIAKPVSTVRAAKQALMPPAVWEQVKSLPPGETDNRRNAFFRRQGEWFFVPGDRDFRNPIIFKNEFLKRAAGGKPHLCAELIREGGERVYIVGNRTYTEAEYRQRKLSEPNFDPHGPRVMVANAEVYVRGTVRHADHATIELKGWHRVFINAEPTTSSVAFLD